MTPRVVVDSPLPMPGGEWHERLTLEGVGPDAPIGVNDQGGRQTALPYRCDLLPARAMLELAKVLKHGADKYGVDNWRSISSREHLNHAQVHQFAHLAGDRQEGPIGHLSHALCRMAMALEMAIAEEAEKNAPDYGDAS